MTEHIDHQCSLAGMQAKPGCELSTPSVVQTFIHRLLNRGESGWGLKGNLEGQLQVEAGGSDPTSLCENPRCLDPREKPVTSVIAHGRYVTSGIKPRTPEEEKKYRQPFLFKAAGMWWSFCFNGTIANYPELKDELKIDEPDVDTEGIRRIFIEEIEKRAELIHEDFAEGMRLVFEALEKRLDGCFNIILINERDQLAVYRDHHGFRPIVKSETPSGDVLVASEDSAIRRTFNGKDSHGIRHDLWKFPKSNWANIRQRMMLYEFC